MTERQYQFRAWLLADQAAQPKQRKGDRTRHRLQVATIDALTEIGYRDMKVTDICERAGVSSGTFYLYFENKVAITHVVLEEFIHHLDRLLSGAGAEQSAFQTLHRANLEWLRFVRANAGLFRCILHIGDESNEITRLTQELNAVWYRRIVKSSVRRFESARRTDEQTLLLAVYAMGSMMDELAQKLVTQPDPNLLNVVGKVTPSDEELAEFLSLIWYRTLYGGDPEDRPVGGAARRLSALRLG